MLLICGNVHVPSTFALTSNRSSSTHFGPPMKRMPAICCGTANANGSRSRNVLLVATKRPPGAGPIDFRQSPDVFCLTDAVSNNAGACAPTIVAMAEVASRIATASLIVAA